MMHEDTTKPGDVVIENNRATLDFTRFIKSDPARVWKVITDPREFGIWYNAHAEIDPRLGGMFTVHSGPFTWAGKILAWEPTSLFKYEHNHESVEEMPGGQQTIVTWTVTPKPDGTEVRFVQSGLTSTGGFAPGTHVVLDRLVAHIEGREMPDFNDYYGEVEPLYAEWSADNETTQ